MSEALSTDDAVFLALCERARKDSVVFANLQLSVSGPVTPHRMHEFLHLHIELCEKSKRRLNPVEIWPPSMGKTSTTAQRLVWEQGHFPHHRTGLVSANDHRTFETMTIIRNAFLNPITKMVFPHLEPDVERSRDGRGGGWSNDFLYFRGYEHPAFQAKKFLGQIEGGRFDRILLDDTVTEKNKDSVVIRERTHNVLTRSWFRRVNNSRSRCIVLNNVWHPEDAIHKLIENPGFSVFWLGYEGTERMWWRVYNPPEGWPHGEEGHFDLWEDMPEETLRGIYAENPAMYRHLYEGHAMSEEDRTFPCRDDWGEYDRIPGPNEGGRIIAFMDPSGGKRIDKNCYAALVLVTVTPKQEILVLDCFVDRVPVNKQIEWPFEMAAKWRRRGYQVWATGVEALRKEDDWILPRFDEEENRRKESGRFWQARIEPRRPIENKESRIQALIPAFVHHEILFPKGFKDMLKGQSREARSWRQLVDQTEYYRGEKTGFVDAPDALAGAVELAQSYGPKVIEAAVEYESPADADFARSIEESSLFIAQSKPIKRLEREPAMAGMEYSYEW